PVKREILDIDIRRFPLQLPSSDGSSRRSLAIHQSHYFIICVIVLSVLAVMFETVDGLYVRYRFEFLIVEIISVSLFTIEYLCRLWSAVEHPQYQRKVVGRLRFAKRPYMLVDLLAILPFFVGLFVDLRFLRTLRLIRFLRLLKLTRYSTSLQLFVTAIRLKVEELSITSIIGVILLLVASSVMYFAERGAQPEEFSSIPATLWWGAITLTTVGYGDVTPETTLGKAIGICIAIIGIGIVALPASILASGFIEAARDRAVKCPHCNEKILEENLKEMIDQ
ncbi:ion transporter, partial [Natronobiforma cellulositropha]|uniref:ion transporter n=1 Tax=Natronobiforma cellulositropha TaxID=1679076 RepID=UPI0021D5FD75